MLSMQSNLLEYFRLKPVKAARVSEISETTAAAAIEASERVNFHIGNPLQDSRLSSAMARIALGIDVQRTELNDGNPDAILNYLGWDAAEKPKLEFLLKTIQRSSPYMPRGGYSRKNPHALIKALCDWLENQQEALQYDTGEQSGQREIILASGGIHEALRIFLFALSEYIEHAPARVLLYRCEISSSLHALPNLLFETLDSQEAIAREQILTITKTAHPVPTVVIIGELLSEETRRMFRTISIEYPLFFVEVNDAPNHLSLAREAKLVDRALRFLTPKIFSPSLKNGSITFILGNADFLNVIENVHFNLKGSPSASEVELLLYLLDYRKQNEQQTYSTEIEVKPSFEGLGLTRVAENRIPVISQSIEERLSSFISSFEEKVEKTITSVENVVSHLSDRISHARIANDYDEFSQCDTLGMLDDFANHFDDSEWLRSLQQSFLNAFLKHQPQYTRSSCVVVSGSSRTALGLLGFHCGIKEVVIPDLSWSYEQCFPIVHAVPLTKNFELDVPAIIEKLQEFIRRDELWKQRGALVINNPHNATGRIFNEASVRELLTFCLQNGITVIDDLSYQNVAPVPDLPIIKTVRQLASELVLTGAITEEQSKSVITIHSMSKTDCLAGARLAVAEIRDEKLFHTFQELNSRIQPNYNAIFLCYLFYRNKKEEVEAYWRLRNTIFYERIQSLLSAAAQLPADRNPFNLSILPPTGSMYPLLRIGILPSGLSLDWLASNLARRGIGMLPLVTFARTEEGYEIGRTTFRLTLGGVDGADALFHKTRTVLIHLNRLIKDEAAKYNRKQLPLHRTPAESSKTRELTQLWNHSAKGIVEWCSRSNVLHEISNIVQLDSTKLHREFLENYIPERLDHFRVRLLDRSKLHEELVAQTLNDGGKSLSERLDHELMKDSLQRRIQSFKLRTHDRTVHPTQMYSLRAELALDELIDSILFKKNIPDTLLQKIGNELIREYLGLSVPITSRDEAVEILLDLATLIRGECFADLYSEEQIPTLLSFWSDWDGSNRPSGQGHRLVASIVMDNVRRMAQILNHLRLANPAVALDSELVLELERLSSRNRRFTELLDEIMILTQQLERRYKGILPFALPTTPLQKFATSLHLRRDPVKALWQHNDRYERKMLELRAQRRRMLEYYFNLNKKLRKQLHTCIPELIAARTAEPLLHELVEYRDILQRTIITPRIQEGMITARDQFAVDTTVYNVFEINAISGKYGNPGMVLALQISLSTKPEALISLERKLHARWEQTHREEPSVELPSVWAIPLFEDVKSEQGIRSYLDLVWDYATQSRQSDQTPQERFTEIICEIFIAGSDLSQQIGQAPAASFYLKAKYDLHVWLADHGITEEVRIKLGSGEPMQRQGGYYSEFAGQPAFLYSNWNNKRIENLLPPPTRKSTSYAVTPLLGIFSGGDLRTFQSNLSERLRYLPVQNYVDVLYHVKESQEQHRSDLVRALESIIETRLKKNSRTSQELERLTGGSTDSVYENFLKELTENFRQILYGKDEDVVGIHVISYFIGRTIPQLRDRPTSRALSGVATDRGQKILEHIAETIPFAKHGSLLRAIAHNQAQTAILGINQLTTGLFRALHRFEISFELGEQESIITERILPNLPVYEILSSLRMYHDRSGQFLREVETAFPAGNSAFVALREDFDAMARYIPLFQKELVRRHGLDSNDFFSDGVFLQELLPTLRPDLAVLLQKNLFNASYEELVNNIDGSIPIEWEKGVRHFLDIPVRIFQWRKKIWDIIGDSVYQRVQSFSELATALYSFSSAHSFEATPVASRERKLSPALADFFRTAHAEDEMRNFLVGAIEYLSSFTEGNIEMPVSIVRAMNDIERLAQIEEQTLSPQKQDELRYYLLQIARLAGENG